MQRSVIGMESVDARLDKVSDAAADISPTYRTLGAKYAAREDSVFDSNGWGKWAPRAPSTLAESVSPLVQTGIMREGLLGSAPIWRGRNAAAFGASKRDPRVMNIAVLNAVGHKRGTKQVPARIPVPPLRAAEKRDWINVVRDHMREALR